MLRDRCQEEDVVLRVRRGRHLRDRLADDRVLRHRIRDEMDTDVDRDMYDMRLCCGHGFSAGVLIKSRSSRSPSGGCSPSYWNLRAESVFKHKDCFQHCLLCNKRSICYYFAVVDRWTILV